MRIGCCLLLTLCLVLSSCAKPDGQLLQADGTEQAFRFANWQGRWLLINYWAPWCAPCRREIPELNLLNGREDVQVLGVNFDGVSGAKLVEVVASMGVGFPTLLADPGLRFGVERPTSLPVTLVIAPDGVLQKALRGPQTQETLMAVMSIPES